MACNLLYERWIDYQEIQLQCLPFDVSRGFYLRASYSGVTLSNVSAGTPGTCTRWKPRGRSQTSSALFYVVGLLSASTNLVESAWFVYPLLNTASYIGLQPKPSQVLRQSFSKTFNHLWSRESDLLMPIYKSRFAQCSKCRVRRWACVKARLRSGVQVVPSKINNYCKICVASLTYWKVLGVPKRDSKDSVGLVPVPLIQQYSAIVRECSLFHIPFSLFPLVSASPIRCLSCSLNLLPLQPYNQQNRYYDMQGVGVQYNVCYQ